MAAIYSSMTTLLYCLEEAHRKGFAGACFSLSDIQTEVPTCTVVSTFKKQKEEVKEPKVQKQTMNIPPLVPISGLFIKPAQSVPSGGCGFAFRANAVRQIIDG